MAYVKSVLLDVSFVTVKIQNVCPARSFTGWLGRYVRSALRAVLSAKIANALDAVEISFLLTDPVNAQRTVFFSKMTSRKLQQILARAVMTSFVNAVTAKGASNAMETTRRVQILAVNARLAKDSISWMYLRQIKSRSVKNAQNLAKNVTRGGSAYFVGRISC